MEKVRFGVVGTNFIADWMINGARQDERFELAAVYSRTQERADMFAAKHNIPHRNGVKRVHRCRIYCLT